MVAGLQFGDTVKVWPAPGLRVQAHAGIAGRFLSPDGEFLVWSDWIHSRVCDGSMYLTNPNPAEPEKKLALPAKGEK